MSFQDNVALHGLSEQTIAAIFLDEMRSYRASLVHLEAAWKVHPHWSNVSDRDTDLAVFEQLWSGIAQQGLGVPRDWSFVERHFAQFDEEMQCRVRDLLRHHPGLSEAVRADAIRRLEDRGLSADGVSIPVAVDVISRARAEAAKRVREGTDYTDLAHLTSLARTAMPAGSQSWHTPFPQAPVSDLPAITAFSPLTPEQQRYAAMTPTEFAEVFINDQFGVLDHRSGNKRKKRVVKESTYRDVRWACLLLEKCIPVGTPLSQVTADQLKELDAWFDRLPTMVGKSPFDREASTTLSEIAERAVDRVEKREIDAGDIGLSTNTTNKHWHNLVRIRARLCELVPTLRPFNVSSYIGSETDDARDARDKLTHEQGRAIFKLPPWTGCAGINDRLTKGTTIIHDALYFVLLLVWYTGARREEICKLRQDDIFADEEICYIYLRDTDTGGVKTTHATRKIPIHSELLRLGFVEYVRATRQCGEKLLFPELYPAAGTKRAIGDVFYKIWWLYIRPLIPGLKRGQAMHAARHTGSDALKQAGISLEARNDFFGHSQMELGEGAARYSEKTGLKTMKDMVEIIPNVTDHLPDFEAINLLPSEQRIARPSRKSSKD